jgi:hypothetical protein
MTRNTALANLRASRVLLIVALATLTAGPQAESFQHGQPPLSGAHKVRQMSTRQYLDAHDTLDRDFGVVTRPPQDNLTQQWIFHHEGGGIYTIQQQHTGRFLDAHDTPDKDFGVVLRPRQPNPTQRWIVTHVGPDLYHIQQVSTRRFLDAHESLDRDFAAVTRPRQIGPQTSSTQRWIIR